MRKHIWGTVFVLVLVETVSTKGAKAPSLGSFKVPEAYLKSEHFPERTWTHLHLIRAMLFLYFSMASAFLGSPSAKNRLEGITKREVVRHMGHVFVVPASRMSVDLPSESRQFLIH